MSRWQGVWGEKHGRTRRYSDSQVVDMFPQTGVFPETRARFYPGRFSKSMGAVDGRDSVCGRI